MGWSLGQGTCLVVQAYNPSEVRLSQEHGNLCENLPLKIKRAGGGLFLSRNLEVLGSILILKRNKYSPWGWGDGSMVKTHPSSAKGWGLVPSTHSRLCMASGDPRLPVFMST